MKGQMIVGEDRHEIVLDDNRLFQSKKNEDPDQFYARVANKVDEELMEPLEITSEMSLSKLKRRSSEDLRKKLKDNPSTLEVAMCTSILVERGVLDESELTVEDPKGSISTEQAKQNIGKECTFTPWGGDVPIRGTIKSVVTDKRVGTDQYRIECPGGKIKSKRTESDKITIHN